MTDPARLHKLAPIRTNAIAVLAAVVSPMLAGPALAVDGASVFLQHCAACHMSDGAGTPGLAPPLVSEHVKAAANLNPLYATLVVLNGLSGPVPLDDGSVLKGIMPPVGMQLSDEEVAAVVSHVLTTLNGIDVTIDPKTVADLRPQRHSAKELRAMREDLVR